VAAAFRTSIMGPSPGGTLRARGGDWPLRPQMSVHLVTSTYRHRPCNPGRVGTPGPSDPGFPGRSLGAVLSPSGPIRSQEVSTPRLMFSSACHTNPGHRGCGWLEPQANAKQFPGFRPSGSLDRRVPSGRLPCILHPQGWSSARNVPSPSRIRMAGAGKHQAPGRQSGHIAF